MTTLTMLHRSDLHEPVMTEGACIVCGQPEDSGVHGSWRFRRCDC